MISLKGVSKSYKGITIFEDVNITFMPNKWNFIEGVNGSGKSVLLKLICGFSKPDTGIVMVDDYIIGQDYDFIQNAGICINSPDFFNNLSGMDNLLEIAKIKKIVTKNEIYQLVDQELRNEIEELKKQSRPILSEEMLGEWKEQYRRLGTGEI